MTPLLRFAEEHIPYEQLGETDLLIFATAGMRLLPEAYAFFSQIELKMFQFFRQKDAIIKNLQNGLKSVTALRVSDSNIRIIDGAWEGIYSWIAVNYILGMFPFSIYSIIVLRLILGLCGTRKRFCLLL